jgi:hypothetical protein
MVCSTRPGPLRRDRAAVIVFEIVCMSQNLQLKRLHDSLQAHFL